MIELSCCNSHDACYQSSENSLWVTLKLAITEGKASYQ